MRYLVLLILASLAIVACADSEAPECTSPEVSQALHDYLADPADYVGETPKVAPSLQVATIVLSNFRTESQDTGLHSSRCRASVTVQKNTQSVTAELLFSDHLTGDKRHVVDADLTALAKQLEGLSR